MPCTTLRPPAAAGPLPVVLFLFGGGGNAENLAAIAPGLSAAWDAGELTPMCIACAGVPPFCFYVDDPERGTAWETAVGRGLVDTVRARFPVRADRRATGLVGISMGGYGALKIAFAQPAAFAAVAAVAPMIEPVGTTVPLRNRFHYPPDVPASLLGSDRDARLYQADHPAHRARRNVAAIRDHDLAIRIDAGSRDALHAHDGAESLHRALWDLDIRHAYELHRDADHIGPSLLPRLLRAFAWVGTHVDGHPSPDLSAEETALHGYLDPLRRRAEAGDPTMGRVYGRLPPIDPPDYFFSG